MIVEIRQIENMSSVILSLDLSNKSFPALTSGIYFFMSTFVEILSTVKQRKGINARKNEYLKTIVKADETYLPQFTELF